MTVETNAVAGTMRQARYFVVRAKAGVSDYFACGGINGFTGRAYFCCRKTGVLRSPLQIPNLALPLGWLTENERASYIRLVSINAATAVHQHHVAFLQLLRRATAVRKSCVLAKTAKDTATHSQR